jgi:hypothetical protein
MFVLKRLKCYVMEKSLEASQPKDLNRIVKATHLGLIEINYSLYNLHYLGTGINHDTNYI